MHIAEGVLSAPALLAGAVVATAGIAYGLYRIPVEKIPQTAILAAVFFVGSFVHIPIGPSQAHLVLNGFMGLLLGWGAFPAIFIALVLQAVFFQYGGLTTLGVNTVVMALPAVIAGVALKPLLAKGKTNLAGILAAVIGIGGSGCLLVLSLISSGEGFVNLASLVGLAHLPIMIVEAIVTSFILLFLQKIRPEMLGKQ